MSSKTGRDARGFMKNWLRKWTYEVLLAFGDALWAVCVVQFADFLSRLTIRKVIEFLLSPRGPWLSRKPSRLIRLSCLPATP